MRDREYSVDDPRSVDRNVGIELADVKKEVKKYCESPVP